MKRLIVIPLALALAACGADNTTEPLTNDDFAPELNVNLGNDEDRLGTVYPGPHRRDG